MKKHNYLLFNIIIFLSLFISCSKQENKYKLIPIKSAEKWGYINHKGEYVINPQFIEADFFYEGLAKVKGFDEKIGYISEDGKYEIDANYKNGTIFSDGLAFVVSEGSFPTCIDKKGNTKFVLKDVEFIFAFEEGLAAFKNTEGKWGFIDTKGDIVINAQFEAVGSFNDGYAIIIQNGKRGFINKEGKIVINPQFEHVTIFSEGKAAFFDGKQWGYIDTKGTYIINPQFDEATVFNGGLALVKQGKYYGYINKQGKFEINPQFEEACSFSNKLAVVQLGKTFGYINKQGKYEINPQFEFALEFYNDIAPVLNSEKWGFIDKKGKYVINPQFEAIKIDVEFERSMSMWNFISNYSNNYYVESDYYDASEFVAEFFKKDTGNSFDSINVSTNLKNLAYHETYGNDLQTNNKYYGRTKYYTGNFWYRIYY